MIEIHILDCLRELADAEYQQRAWMGQIPGEMHSIEECREVLFGDSGLAEALKLGTVYSEEIDAVLLELDAALAEIEPLRPAAEILADPQLPRVRRLASALLDGLGGHIGV